MNNETISIIVSIPYKKVRNYNIKRRTLNMLIYISVVVLLGIIGFLVYQYSNILNDNYKLQNDVRELSAHLNELNFKLQMQVYSEVDTQMDTSGDLAGMDSLVTSEEHTEEINFSDTNETDTAEYSSLLTNNEDTKTSDDEIETIAKKSYNSNEEFLKEKDVNTGVVGVTKFNTYGSNGTFRAQFGLHNAKNDGMKKKGKIFVIGYNSDMSKNVIYSTNLTSKVEKLYEITKFKGETFSIRRYRYIDIRVKKPKESYDKVLLLIYDQDNKLVFRKTYDK